MNAEQLLIHNNTVNENNRMINDMQNRIGPALVKLLKEKNPEKFNAAIDAYPEEQRHEIVRILALLAARYQMRDYLEEQYQHHFNQVNN